MLWIAGLLGMMTVGTVTMVDFNRTTMDDAGDDADRDDQATLLLAEQMRADLARLDTVDPDAVGATDNTENHAAKLDGEEDHPQTQPSEAGEDLYAEAGDGKNETSPLPVTDPGSDIQDACAVFGAFDPHCDTLVVVWDDSMEDAPEIDLAPSDTDPRITELRAGDEVIARVPADCGFGHEHVAIIPQSVATGLGYVQL